MTELSPALVERLERLARLWRQEQATARAQFVASRQGTSLATRVARGRTVFAASQEIRQGHAGPAPDSFDLMIHIAEEGGPMKLVRLFLGADGQSPVEPFTHLFELRDKRWVIVRESAA